VLREELMRVAAELSERYFEPVFMEAKAEFEVHEWRTRSLRRRSVEDGLLLWEIGLTETASDDREPVRRRHFFSRRWERLQTVQQAADKTAAQLDRLLGERT
jgi:hypothetical protein